MVRIRLTRLGQKKRPFYRVVVADSRKPRDGRIIESIGTYDPGDDPVAISIDQDRARYWLSTGARPSATVKTLFREVGVYRSDP